MSMAIGHFSVGAAISLIIFRLIDYYSKKIRLEYYLRYDLLVVVFGGLWAMIPDLPYVFNINFISLHSTQFCNLFFFHCYLDKIDPADTIIFSTFMFGIFLVDTLVITWLVTHKKQLNQMKNLVKKQIHI